MTDRMTDAELDEIQARVDAATEGPWRVDDAGDIVAPPPPSAPSWQDREWVVAGDGGRSAVSLPDAQFVAAARTDVPRLLAEVRALRAQIAAPGIEVHYA